ncbi:MAG: hypothetical protein OXE94_04810 [Aestuariivita sp.]|nr:hypothetical protein [Aestuariivita sp.]MCY4201234.1 hypothetical protein [Aestuariivita sp.]
MTPQEFEAYLDQSVQAMNRQAVAGMPGYSNAGDFEETVLAQLKIACERDANVAPAFHDSAFPDIVVNGFGVEVKFTSRSTWHGTGNSIFEGMRDETARHIYLVYFRSDLPEARWSKYQDCIKGVRISHSPRYMIDMDGQGTFFWDLGMTLERFKDLEMKNKMALVKQDVQKRVKEGERLWWFGDEQDHTIPVNLKIYRNLSTSEKAQMRTEAALMCPEIFRGSRARTKYDGIAAYLLTQHGVLVSNVRDMFSAGSVAGTERGGDYLLRSVTNNMNAIRKAAAELDGALFVEYWGTACAPEKRMTKWFELIDAERSDDPPSVHLLENEQ